jgi:hypothetical protein
MITNRGDLGGSIFTVYNGEALYLFILLQNKSVDNKANKNHLSLTVVIFSSFNHRYSITLS